MDEKDNLAKGLEQRCTELKKQVEYYKNIAEKTGQKRLREVEQLNRLIFERKKSEKALRASSVSDLLLNQQMTFSTSGILRTVNWNGLVILIVHWVMRLGKSNTLWRIGCV